MSGEDRLPGPGSRAAAVAATALAVALVSWLSIATPTPTVVSPYSLTVVIPYLWSGGPLPAVGIWPALFLAPGVRLAAGRLRPPGLSAALFAVMALASLGFAAWGIRPGTRHYGGAHTLGILAADLALIAWLGVLLARSQRRPSFRRLLSFHGLLWGWFAWIGLPWLRQLF